MYVDKAYQKEIDVLEVYCCNSQRGCKWTAALNQLMVSNDKNGFKSYKISKLLTFNNHITLLSIICNVITVPKHTCL